MFAATYLVACSDFQTYTEDADTDMHFQEAGGLHLLLLALLALP